MYKTSLYQTSLYQTSLYQYTLYNSNVHDKFQSCTVHVQVATTTNNNPRANPMVYVQTQCTHYGYMIFLTRRRIIWVVQWMLMPMHLIANSHYSNLLLLYKTCLCTSILYMMLAMCKTIFRVVQLIYSSLRQFATTLELTLWYVYRHNVPIMLHMMLLIHRTHIGVVQWMCMPTHLIANNHYVTLLQVYKTSLCTSILELYNVSNVHDKFQNFTVDVLVTTIIYNNHRVNPVVCVDTMCPITLHMMVLICRMRIEVVQWKFMPTHLIEKSITIVCCRCTKLLFVLVCSIRC